MSKKPNKNATTTKQRLPSNPPKRCSSSAVDGNVGVVFMEWLCPNQPSLSQEINRAEQWRGVGCFVSHRIVFFSLLLFSSPLRFLRALNRAMASLQRPLVIGITLDILPLIQFRTIHVPINLSPVGASRSCASSLEVCPHAFPWSVLEHIYSSSVLWSLSWREWRVVWASESRGSGGGDHQVPARP